ncbi:ferritin, heavy subunit-like [Stegostoma tigrinum]|uniref:ferritin, heavy subunit-like n=1 Tax=Stegostoma tigrinum TaxID=3053191 RepID=UPI002870730B|nr:ferritin, heavy subunit-like [Stegostoma tigrinum]
MPSQVWQNHHKACEDVVNKQITLVLSFSHVYLSMVTVVFSGFISDFKLWPQSVVHSPNEMEVLLLFSLVSCVLSDVSCLLPSTPTLPLQKPDHGNGLEARQGALQKEKDVNQSLLDLHNLSSGHTDPHIGPKDGAAENFQNQLRDKELVK